MTQPLYVMKTSLGQKLVPLTAFIPKALHEHKSVKVLQGVKSALDDVRALRSLGLVLA